MGTIDRTSILTAFQMGISALRRSAIFWLMIAPFFLSCGFVYQADWFSFPEESSLTGRVILEAGRGFDDVRAELTWLGDEEEGGDSWILDISARGEFREEDLPPGDYRLDIIKPRYDPYIYRFSLGEQERIYLEVELMRSSLPEQIWDVRVVGDFLDWDPDRAVPMEDDDGDGVWKTAIPLPSGRHGYQYIINGMKERFIDIDSRIYEPDSQGYFRSVVELDEAELVEFHLDANDSWYRRASFQAPQEEARTGWVIWEPEEPRKGQEISILYDARGGPLEGAQQMLLHWGVNGWTPPPRRTEGAMDAAAGQAVQSPMEPLSQEIWWIVIPTDESVEMVDFMFTDGQRWDQNGTEGWHIPVLSFGDAEETAP